MAGPDNDLNAWRKSSYSGGGGSECVEVGRDVGAVLVRDTRDRGGAVLEMGAGAWRRFTGTVKASG